ncbi:MAG: DUF4159 domain-containing protein [Pseudomonadota bacterium]
MFGLSIAFASPWLLLGLISLPIIWWLLRLTPPRPQEETFPPTEILAQLHKDEETAAQSPWWLTLLRLLLAAIVIIAMSGPILNPEDSHIAGTGPVVVVVDDGWASAAEWENRRDTALKVVSEAESANRTVILQSSANRSGWSELPVSASEAAALLQASEPMPLPLSHDYAATRLGRIINGFEPGQIVWLSDGLQHAKTKNLTDLLSQFEGDVAAYFPDAANVTAIGKVSNEPSQMSGNLIRANSQIASQGEIVARDGEGVVRARAKVDFAAGETTGEFVFDQPIELRNQFTRLETEQLQTVGGVRLLDENNRRRLVGLLSGETFDQSQPLLSPLYYISRALEPFSDIRRSDSSNVSASVPDLINQGVSAIILADIGNLSDKATRSLTEWIEKGGMLVRFAGPRLGSSPQGELLPVEIRPGDRSLGGALSWDTPKSLAAFDRESPFFGIEPPRDVLVKKQLLALQEQGLDQKTWSRLEDGTPLVTAEQRGFGWLVLFHVGTDSDWSNLPLSGTFVEMLRRTVNLAKSGKTGGEESVEVTLPPLKILNAYGGFTSPNEDTQALTLKKGNIPGVTTENPPGFYGTEDGVRALNLFANDPELIPMRPATLGSGIEQRTYIEGNSIEFRNWLLALAGLLLIVDCVIVLWMSGALRLFQFPARRTAPILIATTIGVFAMLPITETRAQDIDYSAALETRLAYVITGISDLDRISEAGLRGLTRFIASRTALEPGEPVGLDISTDELSFYSLLYWPIAPQAELPDEATMARIDAFMKQGGSILFDTRDQISGVLGGTSASPAAQALQEILSGLDIPPLEPVPSDHVLTKAFYLLDEFPGRFNGGALWVEVSRQNESDVGRPARSGDGVSSILITSNDFAGAWAVDGSLRPLLPTVPPDPAQRNYAFRSGVNLVMYALTGNYKADQVHLPALLERLGQ